MKPVKNFGELSPVDLRKYWEKEDKDFTPWLAESENLTLLGETIGMYLELEGTEQSVGDFKVDILAKETGSDQYVVIENQLEKTNHKHLGQLLTYASGYSAKAIIWIAKEIDEEHRKALDWLNDQTFNDVRFFGVEMELWKIGDSQAAPKFNLVSKPNDWSKRVQQDSRGWTKIKALQQEFWTNLLEYIRKKDTVLKLPNKSSPGSWCRIPVISTHKAKFWIGFVIRSRVQKIDCELCLGGTGGDFDDLQKDIFEDLKKEKKAIEQELGTQLEWKEERNVRKIVQSTDADFKNKEEWPRVFEWLKERAEAFYKTFSGRVKGLDLDDEAA